MKKGTNAAVIENEEEENGNADETIDTNNPDESLEEGALPKGSGEGEEETPEVEGADGEDGEDEEPITPTTEERLGILEKENKELKERLEKGAGKPETPIVQKEPTEEEWQAWEDQSGMDRKSIRYFQTTINSLAKLLMDKMDQRFSKYDKVDAISNLSKQTAFKDAQKYREGMEEFLEGFDPRYHSDPKILEKAYFYAVGKNNGKTVKKIMNAKEINRQVINKSKISSPKAGSNGGGKSFNFKLTPSEESAWQSFGRNNFESKEEYAKSLSRYRNAKK